MEPIAKIRFLVAAGVSPLLMPLLVYMTFLFIFGGDVEKNQEMQTRISTATWVSFFLAVLFGGASYYWLRRKNWCSVWRYLMMGAVSGLASWIIFSIISQTMVSLLFYVFIIAGSLMGVCFWLTAYFQPDGNHLISSSVSGRRKRRRA
jgi:uncharacterized membrane protein YfcA